MRSSNRSKKSLRVGVVGVGHLGGRHAEIYASMPEVHLVGICDSNTAKAEALALKLGCRVFSSHHHMVGKVDVASLAVPTSLHTPIGLPLLAAGIHLLIEKPICTSLPDASRLIAAARKAGCVLQVGHVERFNAAIHAAMGLLKHPRFIEVHRLSSYPFRGTDVSVVLDVMIHDLDLILALVRSPVKRVEAVGVPVLSPTEDIANARVTFGSGCVANLTASRISDGSVRRIRVFQQDSYLSIDYQAQSVEMARKTGTTIERVNLPVNRRPPLQDELAAFIRSIRTGKRPLVSGEDGKAALGLALRIERAMRHA